MKAMLLSAGIGSRLRPMTDHMPKALVKINGIPLLEIVIRRMIAAGYHDIIINVHHFPQQIMDFVAQQNHFGIHIEFSDESDGLLDTGGGLQKAAWFFDDGNPFLVHNVDILTDIDLDALWKAHVQGNALATLAVRHRTTSRYLLFDNALKLCGWTNKKTGEFRPEGISAKGLEAIAFSGIQILDPKIFNFMNREGAYSLITLYTGLCRTCSFNGFVHDDGYWSDVGKPDELLAAEEWFKKNRHKIIT